MSAGRLIAVVGPSGVGKDTLMHGLAAAEPRAHLARRVITRPAEAGGEDFDAVSAEAFAARSFALSWQAHGLHYGIPEAALAPLATGGDVLVNLSRSVLPEAAARWPGMVTLALEAPPEILAARLAARGRESAADIAARLARARFALPEGVEAVRIDTSAAPEAVVAAAHAALYPPSGTRVSA